MFLKLASAVFTLLVSQTHAKFVFAHFMTSNAENYTAADWADDIRLAQEAKIGAFALNTARGQGDDPRYEMAFQAAAPTGFKMFFSFDYAGDGAWIKEDVIALLQKYGSHTAHYQFKGKPFVSTFEGPEQANDWIEIKAKTGCFLVPSWSSLGAKDAANAAGGVADGLFSWAAWPWGNKLMDTFVDASYRDYLRGKPYLMPVSPWFYTNLPGYSKNWLWKGDSLWFDRWKQVLYLQPEWVEIITWNDYGESHHIGPIRDKALGAMRIGKAPIDYIADMPHDTWRLTLPFVIDLYIQNTTTVTKELVTYWYRIQPQGACTDGRTSGNTASQLQLEFPVNQVLEDKVFFTALLTSIADVSVSIGGVSQAARWSGFPDGNGTGLYHGSVPFNGRLGTVSVTITRNGAAVASGTGKAISTTCGVNGLANWNAWVGSATAGAAVSSKPLTMYGDSTQEANSEKHQCLPVAGLSENYSGLCQFDCALDYCPTGVCATVQAPLSTPTISPFLPPACTSGKSKDGVFPGLCGYACGYGFCPIGICECLTQGALGITPPVIKGRSGAPPAGVDDFGICKWACERGYCPSPCVDLRTGNGPATAFIAPSIWSAAASAAPVVSCIPPCVLVLPGYQLGSLTTINYPPVTKTITQRWELTVSTVVVVTITFAPVVTSQIPVGNINITDSLVDSVTYSNITLTPVISGKTQQTTIVRYTSTPEGNTIFPPIIIRPTKVAFKSAAPPGPSCTAGCGTVCSNFCWACGLSCIFGYTKFGFEIKPGTCVGPWCLKGTEFGGVINGKCTKPDQANLCTVVVSSSLVRTTPTTSWSATTRTRCSAIAECGARDTTVTTTITTRRDPAPVYTLDMHIDQYDGNDYSNYDLSGIRRNFVAWRELLQVRVTTVFVTTTLPPIQNVVTSTVIVRPVVRADCGLWNEGWGWSFQIYNIENWAGDAGRALNKEMKGCSRAMTGWKWHDATTDSFSSVNFNLPYFIRAGCVERAIVSAGGPKLQCSKNGWGSIKRAESAPQLEGDDESLQRVDVVQRGQVSGEIYKTELSLQKRVYTDSAIRPIILTTPTYVYTADTANATYEPMVWNTNDNGTVVLIYTSEQFATVETITRIVPVTATNTNITSTSAPTSTSRSSTTTGTWAVTTAFPALSQCAPTRLTMMIYSQNQIWNNAVLPVPSSTAASCLPSQFVSSVLARASGTVLPPFGKLACPSNWTTNWFNSTYIACCPQNYLLGLPAVRTSGRPGLDGTCYSTLTKGATVTLTSYAASSLLTTTPFVIPSTGFQVFANAFDGNAMNPSPTASAPQNTNV